MVNRVWPFLTSSPSLANRPMILPGYGVNTCTDISSLKSMLPTACFSMGNSRSPTGSTLTEASCESDRFTLSAERGSPAPRLDDRAGISWALALAVPAPRPDLCQSWNGPQKYASMAISNPAAIMGATTVFVLLPAAIDRPAQGRISHA